MSHYAGFSGAIFGEPAEYIAQVDSVKEFEGLKIHNLYMTYGDADLLVKDSFPGIIEAMRNWVRIENFQDYMFPGGTHDFPVWYKGFNDFIQIVFKFQGSEEIEEPVEVSDVEIPTDANDESDSDFE